MASTVRLTRWLVQTLAVAIVYAALGKLALLLALPPSYAALLYPSAGLALAVVLCMGPGLAPGVALGALIVNLLLSHERGQASLLVPALAAAGAGLQALAGAWMVRRWVSQPLLLSEPADLLRFFGLGAGVACLISATIANGALLLAGALPPEQAAVHWLSWWVGDTLGVLIGAPIALTFLAQPRDIWAARRLSVGLPLLLTSLLLALLLIRVSEWDEQRERARFEREAGSAFNAIEAALREPLGALETVQAMLTVAPGLGRQAFERGSATLLQPGSNLLALGWAVQVERPAAKSLDAAARADGLPGFTARDRQRPGDIRPASDEPMLVIRMIEPLARNAPALGVNIRSIPASREALLRAERNGIPTATRGFQLSQDSGLSVGVVIYQALYAGLPGTAQERASAFQGVAFATIRPDLLIQPIAASLPAPLEICVVDTDPLAPHRRLAGPEGCESLSAGQPAKLRSFSFAGRAWDVSVYLSRGGLSARDRSSWAFALIGLLGTAMLGALLLTITGRARRIQALVSERTAELQHEIQQRELASLALTQSEQRFRNIFAHVPIGLVFTDMDMVLREVNPHFCRMLGYPAEALVGTRSTDYTDPADRSEDARLISRLVAGEIAIYRRSKRFIAADGHRVQVRALVTLLRDADGHPQRLLGVVEDVTDQLKMQALEHAREAAEAASRAKNEFLSRMSHELRTPLNAMLGFTQLLEMDQQHPLSPRQQGWTAQVQHAGWHLLEMINDILDLSRIESGTVKLALARQDLLPLVDAALSMVEKSAALRQLSVSRTIDESARYAVGDVTRIKQVLTNLLSNAVKYNVEGGRIQVSSRRLDDQMLEVCVTDTGLGLDPRQLAELFQPFNRLGRESGTTEGTGIGLVISKRLAELMGGGLEVSSVTGQGSTFALRLPLAAPDEAAAPTPPSQEREHPRASAARRVVYIEDNAANVEVMRGILAQRPGWQLDVHRDGASGLAAVLAEPPDLLLLDMQLPDTDGLALLSKLRATPQCAKLPVVVVSANALPAQVASSHDAGVQHYLTKPVDVRQLLTVLDQLLGA
ncbi:MAG: histidine kinase [Methylibium sp.]|nr:histidine kinase [Methylibium sp.]